MGLNVMKIMPQGKKVKGSSLHFVFSQSFLSLSLCVCVCVGPHEENSLQIILIYVF